MGYGPHPKYDLKSFDPRWKMCGSYMYACCGKVPRPYDPIWCSTTNCFYSRPFLPTNAWKPLYKQQKHRQFLDRKHQLLMKLGRCYGPELLECVNDTFSKVEENVFFEPEVPKPKSYSSIDFRVRPWQQQFVPRLQEAPCEVHGFDKVIDGRPMEPPFLPRTGYISQLPYTEPQTPYYSVNYPSCRVSKPWVYRHD